MIHILKCLAILGSGFIRGFNKLRITFRDVYQQAQCLIVGDTVVMMLIGTKEVIRTEEPKAG